MAYLVRTIQQVMAAMVKRLPASTLVGTRGSCTVRVARRLGWAGCLLEPFPLWSVAESSCSVPHPPPYWTLWHGPSQHRRAASPGGTNLKALLWTLTLFSAWHWNQPHIPDSWKLAGCPWCGLCCM
jgi:hypothetical protein